MPRISAFEEHTDAYDDWFTRHAEDYAAELDAIRALLPTDLGHALEIGVGTGKFAVPLGFELGLEPSVKMAARARAQGIEVIPGVAEDLPFPDRTFDCVLMVTTICFLEDVDRALQETCRVLRPGGAFLVGFVDVESVLGQQYLEKQQSSRFYQEATFYTTSDVLSLLQRAGFVEPQVCQTLMPGRGRAVINGSGEGAFVTIRVTRPASS